MPFQCFMADRTNRYRRELRRYVSSLDQTELCPGKYRYHNAVRFFGVVDAPAEDAELEGNACLEYCSKDDLHWPSHCECGYEFKNSDMWQWNQHRLYRNPITGEEFTTFNAPTGAMWYADWMGWKGPDGRCLVVATPGGEWMIDGPSTNGDRSSGPCWTRTGTPPIITARPSILMRDYHGFLTDGFLSDNI